jgi:spermidine/putrescine-binding protein
MRNSTIIAIASAGLATAAVIPNDAARAQAPSVVTTEAPKYIANQETNYMARDIETASETTEVVTETDEEYERELEQAYTDHVSIYLFSY